MAIHPKIKAQLALIRTLVTHALENDNYSDDEFDAIEAALDLGRDLMANDMHECEPTEDLEESDYAVEGIAEGVFQ